MHSAAFLNTYSLGNTSSKDWAESVCKVGSLSTARFASMGDWVQLDSLCAVCARVKHMLKAQLLGVARSGKRELYTLSTGLTKRTTKYINRSIV